MKKIVLLFMAIMPYVVFGQKAQIEFEETSHNFGTVNENAGKAVCDFVFKNTGTTPLILTDARAGCGCTVPEWDRQPVAPGEKGKIKVSFDPRNRPGSFVKSITVNSNAANSVMSLTIRGNVSRKPASPYDSYQFSAGSLKMTNNNVNLGAIRNTQQMEKSIEVINSNAQPMTITASTLSPNITVTITPATLQKDQKGKIDIKYDAAKRNDWGFVTDLIHIKENNKEIGTITVVANISEDFSPYNGNFEKAPVIVFSEEEANLSDVPKNSTQTHEFYIQNDGQSELIIRKIKTSDDQVSVVGPKHPVKPGKKAKVTVTFKTGNTPKVTRIVQFTSNDPQKSLANYKINANTK